jgi:hypothetical protein
MSFQPTEADSMAPLAAFRPSVLGHLETLAMHLRRLHDPRDEVDQRRLERALVALDELGRIALWRELNVGLQRFHETHLAPLQARGAAAGELPAALAAIHANVGRAYHSAVYLTEQMLQIDEDLAE